MSIDKKLIHNLKKIIEEENQNKELNNQLNLLLEKLDSGEDYDFNKTIEDIINSTNV